MEYLYVLARNDGNGDFKDLSAHATVNSALFKLYGYLRLSIGNDNTLGRHNIELDIQDIRSMDMNSLFADYNYVTLYSKFRITKIRNLTTSESALKNIVSVIDRSFSSLLSIVPIGARVCFPVELLSEDARREWKQCDPVNANEVIRHLENYIQIKINELSIQHNIGVIRKDCDSESDEYDSSIFPVSLGNGSTISFFNIVVSPGGGY